MTTLEEPPSRHPAGAGDRVPAQGPTAAVRHPDAEDAGDGGPGASATTRLLAATTYLDADFCDDVIDRVVDEPFMASPLNYGTDAVVVAQHALEARRVRLRVDGVLAVLTLSSVAGFVVATFFGHLVAALLILLGGASLAALVVGAHAHHVDQRVLARSMQPDNFDPASAPLPRDLRTCARLDAVAARQNGNVMVFGSHPFSGSGQLIDYEELAIDVGQGAGGRAPKSFDAGILHEALRRGVEELRLPHLDAEERLLAPGDAVHLIPEVLPDRSGPPLGRVSPDQIRRLTSSATSSIARAYVAVEARDWDSQLVVTTYVRAVRMEKALFLEWAVYALLPLSPRFQRIDYKYPTSDADIVLSAVRQGALGVWTRAPGSIARLLYEARRRSSARRRRRYQLGRITGGLRFDYGARRSLREVSAEEGTGHYFVAVDLVMFVKVTKERVFKVLERFLKEHDVDTGSFTAVQNNFVYSNTTNVQGNSFGSMTGNIGSGSSFTSAGAAPTA